MERVDSLPRAGSGLTAARRGWGLALAVVGLPLLTALLVALQDRIALATVLLLYLLAVVLVSVVGGLWPALFAAVASFLLANWYLTPPFHTLVVERRDSLIALLVFVVVALLVSVTVDLAARRRVAVVRAQVEAQVLGRFTAQPVDRPSPEAILEQVRDVFGLSSVALCAPTGTTDGGPGAVLAQVGDRPSGPPTVSLPAGEHLLLVAHGRELLAEDRRLMSSLAAAAARAYENRELGDRAARAEQLAEVDRLRAALLAAVSHDLRTPLAGIKAAVSSLRQQDVEWSEQERDELLRTVEDSADRLDHLIANLLAMSRLQAGALSLRVEPVALDEVVARALLDVPSDVVELDVADDLPLVRADAGLLERVVANLVANACRFSPDGVAVRVGAERLDGRILLHVVDHGPGVPQQDWATMMEPFQRLGDRSGDGGSGLGLAIADGFTRAMGGRLVPSTTAGGGLTMTVELEVAP